MVNANRLKETFQWLVRIDSVSKNEKEVAQELISVFEKLGGRIFTDNAHKTIGGNCPNLIVKFDGNRDVSPLMFNAHMDTVEPGKGISPLFAEGVFTSEGKTILGADDKSAIAVLIETMQLIREKGISHCPLEFVFTVCEEIGLQGAKHLDYSLVESAFGYSLDTSDISSIVMEAPGANRLEFAIHGKDAHSGVCPENGINAISLASRAIANLKLGRIDSETTCNIGLIEGGYATNIVPGLVVVKGEVRSHNPDKLEKLTREMVDAFETVIEENRDGHRLQELPGLDYQVMPDFSRMKVSEDHAAVRLAREAARNLGRELVSRSTGGGADANVFFEKNIMACILGTGMKDVHTTDESIRLDDMVKTVELVIEIIRFHSEKRIPE